MKYQETPDITLKDLIEKGYIKEDVIVYASSNVHIEGRLTFEGAIILKINGEEQLFPFPSGAARAVVNLNVNGWKFWKIKENDKYIELSEIKKKYLSILS